MLLKLKSFERIYSELALKLIMALLVDYFYFAKNVLRSCFVKNKLSYMPASCPPCPPYFPLGNLYINNSIYCIKDHFIASGQLSMNFRVMI